MSKRVLSPKLLSRVHLFETPWAIVRQVLLCMDFSRQEYWGRLTFPPPGDPPDLGIKLVNPHLLQLLHWQVGSLRLSHLGSLDVKKRRLI